MCTNFGFGFPLFPCSWLEVLLFELFECEHISVRVNESGCSFASRQILGLGDKFGPLFFKHMIGFVQVVYKQMGSNFFA